MSSAFLFSHPPLQNERSFPPPSLLPPSGLDRAVRIPCQVGIFQLIIQLKYFALSPARLCFEAYETLCCRMVDWQDRSGSA